PSVTGPSCPTDQLVLQVPAWPLLEGDTVTLRCRGFQDMLVIGMGFYHEFKEVRRSLRGPLSPLQLHHSSRYYCGGWMNSELSLWQQSVPVTVTVHGQHLTPRS
ncbi:FCGR2 protein, partial [Pycnonotus jocosus]|nr:FCGR2 protein [Pycnonotus jocosus]